MRNRIDGAQTVIDTWDRLHVQFNRMTDTEWIFRGVTAPDHNPIPTVGRERIYGTEKRAREGRLFQEFKHGAVTFVLQPDFTDWHWLACARHLGVPTRLLAWTSSPLLATFFALQAESETDGAVFCVPYSKFIYEVDQTGNSPYSCRGEGRFTPPFIFDRIRAQRGLFTVHPDPTKIFYREGRKALRIPRARVNKFRKTLCKYGVDHCYIDPDAEGLGQQMRWQYKSKTGLGSVFMDKD
jgi:hypothetical protein